MSELTHCPGCGKRLSRDWEGDPNVINGTRDFLWCENCEHEVIDEMSPMAVTEKLIAFMRQKEEEERDKTNGN